MSKKVIANTTTRPIYGNYKDGNTISRVLLQPGINEVKPKIFKALMEQSGIRRLLDERVLSVSKSDLKEIKEMQESSAAGEKSDAPKPVKSPASRDEGASLSKTSDAAIEDAVNPKKKTSAKK